MENIDIVRTAFNWLNFCIAKDGCYRFLMLNYTGQLKCDGTRAENRFRLSAKRTIPFKSAGWGAVQSTAGSRGVRHQR